MQTTLRTLGPNEARAVLTLREQGREVVSAREIIDIVGTEPTGRKVIFGLLKKGWLTRLKPGRYLFLPPEHGPINIGENNALALASAVVDQSYVSWWAAASFHGLTTQRPMSVCVAVLKRTSTRVIEDTEVRFIKVPQKKFFGWNSYKIYGREARISRPAKSIVDCIDRPDLAGGPSELARIVYGASRSIDSVELLHDAFQVGSASLLQRLGFLIDLVGWRIPTDQREELLHSIPRTIRSRFGRAKPRKDDIGYVADWRLFVNARRADLLADVPASRSAA